MVVADNGRIEAFLSAMSLEGRSPSKLLFSLRNFFDGVSLSGRSVLDIGAGEGDTSLYAACAGASRVVSLEPEAAGSGAHTREVFERVRDAIRADQVELRAESLQEFDADGERFDVLVSKASINHLDEDACIRLAADPTARDSYREIFGGLAELATGGADLVIVDCARRNLFGDLGVTNPFAPMIEWEKHQSPRLWASLLAEVGFGDPRIRWLTFNRLGRPGQTLLGNWLAAYLTTSLFWLRVTRG